MSVQLLPLESIRPGMRLARSLYRADGSLLLAKGAVLHQELIAALQRQQIGLVYVADDYFSDTDVPDLVRTEVREQAQQAVAQALNSLPASPRMKTRSVMQVIETILDDVLHNPHAVLALVDARTAESELIQHSAGTAVLCICLGMQLGLSRTDLRELGAGALLHDVGKAVIPSEILYKPGRLTPEERKVVETHPEHGFQVLRQIADFPLLGAHIAYQHHERMDGSGYPRGLKQADIHMYGAICGVADVYDAMTSPRPYRNAIHPAAALHWIRDQAGTLFHRQVVGALTRVVAPYPVATLVELNTGEVGLVRELSGESLERPQVVIVRDASGAPARHVRVVDLAVHPELQIRRHVESTGFVKP